MINIIGTSAVFITQAAFCTIQPMYTTMQLENYDLMKCPRVIELKDVNRLLEIQNPITYQYEIQWEDLDPTIIKIGNNIYPWQILITIEPNTTIEVRLKNEIKPFLPPWFKMNLPNRPRFIQSGTPDEMIERIKNKEFL